MKTFFWPVAIIMVAMSLMSCTTMTTTETEKMMETPVFSDNALPSEQYLTLFRDFNTYSGSVALGISGPATDSKKAIGAATTEALKYLAFNKGLAMEVRYSKTVNTDRDMSRFGTLSGGGTSDALLEECSRDMKIKNITWYGGKIGMAVFASMPGMSGEDIPSDWKTKTPVKDGWNMSVGSTTASGRNIQDSIEGAVYNAAQGLLDVDERSVNVGVTLEKTHESGYANDTFQISGNKFKSFTVFALDYEPVSGKVYALVGSRKY